jgi:hypothetical protein
MEDTGPLQPLDARRDTGITGVTENHAAGKDTMQPTRRNLSTQDPAMNKDTDGRSRTIRDAVAESLCRPPGPWVQAPPAGSM